MINHRNNSGIIQVLATLFSACAGARICEATANLNATHENLLFIAAADGATVHREQDNLSYELQFTTSNGGINITGVSLIPNNLGSATFNAFATSPTTVRIELVAGSAAPADYSGALSGTLNLSWSHDGTPSNANLNVSLRAIDVAELVVFQGYTSTSLAGSDITPITLNGSPPFGAARYVWSGVPPTIPVGLTFSLVGHDDPLGPQTRRWVVVGGGPAWTNQSTTFGIQFSNNLGNMAHLPLMTFELRLRSCSGLTIYQGQSLYSLEGPISAPGASPLVVLHILGVFRVDCCLVRGAMNGLAEASSRRDSDGGGLGIERNEDGGAEGRAFGTSPAGGAVAVGSPPDGEHSRGLWRARRDDRRLPIVR